MLAFELTSLLLAIAVCLSFAGLTATYEHWPLRVAFASAFGVSFIVILSWVYVLFVPRPKPRAPPPSTLPYPSSLLSRTPLPQVQAISQPALPSPTQDPPQDPPPYSSQTSTCGQFSKMGKCIVGVIDAIHASSKNRDRSVEGGE